MNHAVMSTWISAQSSHTGSRDKFNVGLGMITKGEAKFRYVELSFYVIQLSGIESVMCFLSKVIC